jgi:hypothetical protein
MATPTTTTTTAANPCREINPCSTNAPFTCVVVNVPVDVVSDTVTAKVVLAVCVIVDVVGVMVVIGVTVVKMTEVVPAAGA